jgi:hypothetical protein
MTRAHRLLTAAALPMALCLPAPARAESDSDGKLSGSAQIGFRLVDVGGRHEKFNEDVNLASGPRVFRFDLDVTPPLALREAVDRVEVDFQNMGGDPFETFHVAARKFGRYALKYDRHRSSYFYDDLALPQSLANPSLSNAGDLHRFDFERVRDSGSLSLHLGKAARLSFGFDRSTRKGTSTTTLDIQRDEFELNQKVDESMNEYRGAFEYAGKKLTLVLEERVRRFDNVVEILLPGRSPGENEQNTSALDFYFLDRPYSLRGLSHGARLLVHPDDRLTLQASASLNRLDLDLDVAERAAGTSFAGRPFATDLSGTGQVKRNLDLYDLDMTYLVSARIALLGAVRRHQLDQAGELSLAAAEGGGSWDLKSTTSELGLRFVLSPALTVSGGVRRAVRDVSSTWQQVLRQGGTDVSTRDTGGFATVAWRPSRRFRLTAGYEDNGYEGVYTLASPTSRRILRVRGQYGGGEGFSASGSYRLLRSRNGSSGWQGDSDILDVRLGYRLSSFSASLGYSRLDLRRNVDQLVTTLPGAGGGVQYRVPVAYDVGTDALDGRLIWSFLEGFRLGGQARMYESKGSFALRRKDLGGWLEAELGTRYVAHLGYRALDYSETRQPLNDYDARIWELSIGYRW